jgi:hypothetical protein
MEEFDRCRSCTVSKKAWEVVEELRLRNHRVTRVEVGGRRGWVLTGFSHSFLL